MLVFVPYSFIALVCVQGFMNFNYVSCIVLSLLEKLSLYVLMSHLLSMLNQVQCVWFKIHLHTLILFQSDFNLLTYNTTWLKYSSHKQILGVLISIVPRLPKFEFLFYVSCFDDFSILSSNFGYSHFRFTSRCTFTFTL